MSHMLLGTPRDIFAATVRDLLRHLVAREIAKRLAPVRRTRRR